MKTVKIQIDANFGSKFQEQMARDSLMGMLRAWKVFVNTAHQKNDVIVEINENEISRLDWFNFEKKKWQE